MTVIDLIDVMSERWVREAGTTQTELEAMRQDLGFRLPEDYITFLRWSNGGEGGIGGKYISLWSSREIAPLNRDYRIRSYLPNVLGVGTNGGGIAFGFLSDENGVKFVRVPLGDLCMDSLAIIGNDFTQGMASLFG